MSHYLSTPTLTSYNPYWVSNLQMCEDELVSQWWSSYYWSWYWLSYGLSGTDIPVAADKKKSLTWLTVKGMVVYSHNQMKTLQITATLLVDCKTPLQLKVRGQISKNMSVFAAAAAATSLWPQNTSYTRISSRHHITTPEHVNKAWLTTHTIAMRGWSPCSAEKSTYGDTQCCSITVLTKLQKNNKKTSQTQEEDYSGNLLCYLSWVDAESFDRVVLASLSRV